jgi:2-polyprenyl-3-methyl-5-hydroxy-6-metoxy-1,4-benzoquinol methylase
MKLEQADLQRSYDRVAENYAEQYYREVETKPFDRKMLDWLIEKTGDLGVICDMGCGPGQIASYVHEHGAKACGVDLSSEMVKQAIRLNPDISFAPGRHACSD